MKIEPGDLVVGGERWEQLRVAILPHVRTAWFVANLLFRPSRSSGLVGILDLADAQRVSKPPDYFELTGAESVEADWSCECVYSGAVADEDGLLAGILGGLLGRPVQFPSPEWWSIPQEWYARIMRMRVPGGLRVAWTESLTDGCMGGADRDRLDIIAAEALPVVVAMWTSGYAGPGGDSTTAEVFFAAPRAEGDRVRGIIRAALRP